MALDLDKLRNMTPAELQEEEAGLRDEIFKLRLQRSTGKLQDPHKILRTRKDLARVLTIRGESERGSKRGSKR